MNSRSSANPIGSARIPPATHSPTTTTASVTTSFYAGAALLISCTIPAFFIKKGAWLQHRASTLALWMMFTMAVPTFVSSSQFAVETSRSATALFLVALIALISNVAVFGYQIYTIINRRKNPLKDELYNHHSQFQEVHIANLDVPSSFEAHESHHPVA